jgi:photosystem II PsbY protein
MAAMTVMSMAKPVLRPAALGRASALPFRPVSRSAVRSAPRIQAVQSSSDVQERAVQAVALSTLAGSFLSAGNAAAASEISQIAAGDGRFSTILFLLAPAVGWVLFNIGGPLLNQVQETSQRNKMKLRSGAAGLGLAAASLLVAQNADAAEIAQVAAGDGRILAIATLFAPVIGWVLFNIGGPLLNQVNETAERNKTKDPRKKRGVAAGLGLTAASLLAAQNADAATEIAQVAAGDARILAIATLFVPAIGWVLFNIGGPLLNQVNETAERNKSKDPRKPKGRR